MHGHHEMASGEYVYLQLHADALYEFERYRQEHLAQPALAVLTAPRGYVRTRLRRGRR